MYKPYPKYKESGVAWLGEVPEGWNPIKFKQVLHEKKKRHNLKLNCGSISFGNVIYKDNDSIPLSTKESYQEVLKGEFLVNPLNLNFDLKSLRTALSSLDVVVSTGYIVLQSKLNIKKSYLRWLLHQFDVAHMKTLGAGVRQTINYTDIGNSYFYIPSKEEQTQIANYLDQKTKKIDTLIEKQQTLIKLLQEKRQALISHVVTKGLDDSVPMKESGVAWLGEVPEHWKTISLKLFTTTVKGFAFKSNDFKDNGIPIIKTTDIKNGTIKKATIFLEEKLYSQYQKVRVEEGSIILSTVGSHPRIKNSAVGQIGLVPKYHDGSLLNQNAVIFYPNNFFVLNKYFLFLLKSSIYREYLDLHAHGTANQASLSLEDMLNYKTSIPPLKEQTQIANYLDQKTKKIDILIEKSKDSISLLKERRTALISAVVTGKVKVNDD